MSTLIPERFSCHLSEASEMSQGDDVGFMIARLDNKWRELKKLLRDPEGSIEEQPDLEVSLEDLNPADKVEKEALDTRKSWSNSLLVSNIAKFAITPLEADTIINRMKKIDQETNIKERLVKAEKQRRSLILYAIFCTIIVLFALISTILISMESQDLNKDSLDQTQETFSPAPKASPQQTSITPADQKLPGVVSGIEEPAIPKGEYVGAFNSNKYHYRFCKWTKYIGPTNLRVFRSVAEAQKAGYVRCLTCQSPSTDVPRPSLQ